MRNLLFVLSALVATPILFACTGSGDPLGLASEEALAHASENPWLRTDSAVYHVQTSASGHSVTIGAEFTNRTNGRVYFSRCHSLYPPVLEKLIGGEWVEVYNPPVLLCYQEPLALASGETHAYTYRVIAGLRGSNSYPQFEIAEIPDVRHRRAGGTVRVHHDDGAVALIARQGRIVYLDSMGVIDADSRTPMRSNSIFRIASMSKAVTSVAPLEMRRPPKK
jgi:hypothetical protein